MGEFAPDGAAVVVASVPELNSSGASLPVAPVGPAGVTVDAPIRVGPGPDFGLIVTAPSGSTVQQTGHDIDGYVTVQYAAVTGWLALEHVVAPGSFGEETPLPETTAPVKTSPDDALPAVTPLAETASAEAA
jgi:uncharacterized protein YraI